MITRCPLDGATRDHHFFGGADQADTLKLAEQ